MTIKTKPIANKEPRTAHDRVYGSIRLRRRILANERIIDEKHHLALAADSGCQFCPYPSSRYILLRLSFFIIETLLQSVGEFCQRSMFRLIDHFQGE